MTTQTPRKAKGLRPNCLSFPEVLAQSVSMIAPSTVPAALIAFVFTNAGNGTWFAYLIATIGLAFVCFNINQFARRSASSGALYTYVTRGLGPMAGVLCGWVLTMAYLLLAANVTAGFSHYANIVLGEFGFHLPSVLLFAVCLGISWYYAYTDIQLSAVLMLILEVVSVGAVLLLALLVLAKQGFSIDTSQLTLAGTTPSGISLAMVLAILSFTGFESATTLGDEAKSPTRFIPWAVLWSAVLVGCFYVILSYTMVSSFSSYVTPLDETNTPLSVMANLAGVGLFGVAINAGLVASFFSCSLACINAGARVAYSLSRHRFYPSSWGEAHERNETPYVAVNLSCVFVFLVIASMSLFGIADLDILGYLASIATYGLLFVYILVSIAAPIYLSKLGRLRQRHIVMSVLAVVFMMIPVIGSVYPVPNFPYNIFPYMFLVYLAAGAWLLWSLRRRSPQIIEEIERDLEAIHSRFNH
ncbi:MAG: APC family permease [Cyanobacteria bacterium CRU_2_1]|nr:APC family permease [Cyanobacteria bacterium RU_5_0]NJR57955.1 APC family permease [Cyanobacteria bacterium CRU_2_1]